MEEAYRAQDGGNPEEGEDPCLDRDRRDSEELPIQASVNANEHQEWKKFHRRA